MRFWGYNIYYTSCGGGTSILGRGQRVRYNKLMVFELFRWWYSAGWVYAARSIGRWTGGIEQSFSIPILLRTLFAPWRRIVSAGGRGLDAKMQAALDNFVSRIVGFFVRILVIFAACVMLAGATLAGAVLAIAWPLIPLGIVYCVVRGITG